MNKIHRQILIRYGTPSKFQIKLNSDTVNKLNLFENCVWKI